jgi:polyamine oxidase
VPHLFALPRDPGGSVVGMLGQDAFEAGPILVCFVNPANQGHLRGRSPDEAAAWALRLLAEAIDHPCPDPTEVAVTSWATDPHACGSYTHIPLGARPADCDLLGQPLLGRLLWAGEATWSPRMG